MPNSPSPAAPRLRLIVTDLDGTLLGDTHDDYHSPELALLLAEHRRNGGRWAVNTGRALPHALEGIQLLQVEELPEYILTNERYLYTRSHDTWHEDEAWNTTARARHEELFARAAPLLGAVEDLCRRAPAIQLLTDENPPVIKIDSESTMEDFLQEIAPVLREVPELTYQRNGAYLRWCHRDYHKGSVLRALSTRDGYTPDEILAAGDHYNDLGMLDGTEARHVVCPANAIPAVQETVRHHGGHVARTRFSHGIAEGIRVLLTKGLPSC